MFETDGTINGKPFNYVPEEELADVFARDEPPLTQEEIEQLPPDLHA